MSGEKQTIEIDGTQYQTSSLSDLAKAQIVNINFVDTRLETLRNELAVADTARMAYERALENEQKKTNDNG